MIKSFRKRKFINHKKRILYVSLFFLLLLISIGYAYISTSLSINGVSTIAANSWSIHFANLNVSNGSSVASTPAAIQNDTTKISYSVLLDLPGDFYEFEVDVVNSGTIPGKVSLVNISGISSEAEPYLESSVKYVNGSQVQIGDILNPGTSKRIVVRVGYIEDLNTLPEDTIELDLEFEIDYSQTEEEETTTDTIIQQLKDENASCFTKYEGQVTDKVGETVTASNVYFDKCVDKRNIIFGGFCWQVIRTTETGGLKMIYNGEPVDGKCESNRGNHKGVIGTTGDEMYLADSVLYGNSYEYDTTNNTFTLLDTFTSTWSDSTYEDIIGSYTCYNNSNTCTNLYGINGYKTNTVGFGTGYTIGNTSMFEIGKSPLNAQYGSPAKVGYMFNKTYYYQVRYLTTEQIKYGNSFTYNSSTNTYTLSGTTKTINNWSSGYNQLNNTHYTCWNTSGSCDMISYVYYTTDEFATYFNMAGGKGIGDILTEMLHDDNVNYYNSDIKSLIDIWYAKHLSSYTSKLEDTVYCNDRTILDIGAMNPNGGNTYNYSWLNFNNFNQNTSLVCANQTDQFSVSNNKARLTYPVALITNEEMLNIGIDSLRNVGLWYRTLTPNYYAGMAAFSYNIEDDGSIGYTPSSETGGVRPVVSLNHNNSFVSGTGSEEDPWIVE